MSDKCNKNEHIWNHQEPQPIAVPLLGQHNQQRRNNDYHLDYEFVGRELLINELLTILNETRNTRGCYLISGFRGSGKTTLINKVLSFYKRGVTYPSWLPKPKNDNDASCFNRIINRGHNKLKSISNYAHSRLDILSYFRRAGSRSFKFPRIIKTSRLVAVKVNLGHDEPLSSKDVMCDIATLLYQKLKTTYRFPTVQMPILLAVLVVSILYYFGYFEQVSCWFSGLPFYRTLNSWLHLPRIWVGLLLIFPLTTGLIYYLWTRQLPTVARILYLLKRLNRRMVYTVQLDRGVQNNGFSFSRKETMPPLDARQIENELLFILKKCRKIWLSIKPDIVFVFDELDKIAHSPPLTRNDSLTQPSVGDDLRERKIKIDHLLGALKNFITHGKARFFFIAGREMLDSYQAERGSTSSLYESLFSRIFEVPSLLTDASDHNSQRIHSLLEVYVCRKIIDPDIAIYLWLQYTHRHCDADPCWERDLPRKLLYSPFCLRTYYHYLHFVGIEGGEARRIVLGLRNFIQFLTLHSWGNPKRLQSLFLHFTKPVENADWRQSENVKKITGPIKGVKAALQFGLIDQQRIVLASNLYSQLYHDLGRQLASSGDKLAVSTMAALQYILKFHRYPFNRYHLERMSETLSIYRSPELNTMIDTLLTKVLSPQIRRIRNSHYRYRFNGNFEQEMRYISRVSDIESAAFNFSLDAGAQAKSHYISQLKEMIDAQGSTCKNDVSIHDLCMTLGDLLAVEQSYDEALTYYQKAVDVFDSCTEERRVRFAHLYVEALLRLGEIFERRQRYDRAASVYIQACQTVNDLKVNTHKALENADSKWDVFRQPYWAYMFLHLKRSSIPWQTEAVQPFYYPFYRPEDTVNFYRAGQLAFFNAEHTRATKHFIQAIDKSEIVTNEVSSERDAYIGSYACLHLGENLFVSMMRSLGEHSNYDKDIFVSSLIEKIRESKYKTLDELGEAFRKNYLEEQSKIKKYAGRDERFQNMDVFLTIGLMVFAAKKLESHGLTYHASIAYLKILSIWGMFSEIIVVLSAVNSKPLEIDLMLKKCNIRKRDILSNSSQWIAKLREKSAENITFLTAGGYSRFQARWKSRDVVSIFEHDEPDSETPEFSESSKVSKKLIKNWDELVKPLKEDVKQNFKLKYTDTIGYELLKTLDVLFPSLTLIKTIRRLLINEIEELREFLFHNFDPNEDHSLTELVKKLVEMKVFNKNEFDQLINDIRCENNNSEEVYESFIRQVIDPFSYLWRNTSEASFTQRSLMGQNLIYLSIWEYINKIQLGLNGKPREIPHQTMVPHSTRGLMFSHWLAGRRDLHWSVLKKLPQLPQLIELSSYGDIQDMSVVEQNSKWKEGTDELYNYGASIVHNLNRALYYTRQLAGTDKDILFPDPSMILYDLWQLLYALVVFEKTTGPSKSYDKAVETVKSKLSSSNLRRENTPANLYDFNNVTRRTIAALQDTEQLGDVSNSARTEAIQTRHYLADDFEDPRFHLDWTLVQMYGPAAGILRRYVKDSSKDLKKDNGSTCLSC